MTTQTISPSSGRKLYDLASEYEAILQWLDANEDALEAAGGEIPPELADRLDEIEVAFDEKVERVALMVRTLDARSKVARSEADRLSALARSYGNARDSLKSYLMLQLRKAGKRRVEGGLAKVWVQVNGACSVRPKDPSHPPADYAVVQVLDRLPVMYWEAIRKVLEVAKIPVPAHELGFDATQAIADLKAKSALPSGAGVHEVGALVIERGEHVRIR